MSGQQKFYITTAISYPNGAAAHRPRLRGDRHRCHRALRAARRQGRVLPDRHRRARPQDEADGGRRRASPRASWPTATRQRFRAMAEALEPLQRRFHPHHRAAALSLLGGDLAAHGRGRTTATSSRRSTPAGTPCATRPSTPRSETTVGADGVRRGPQGTPVEWTEEETYLLPPLGLPGQAARPLREAPRLHPAARAAQRGGELRQGRAGGPVGLAHDARLGHPGAGRAGPRHVRVGRRADQLHHRRGLSRREGTRAGATGRPTCT